MAADATPYDTHITNGIRIDQCKVNNCGAVFRINGGYNTGNSGIHKNIVITNNIFQNCNSGIYTFNMGLLDGMEITNNRFENIYTRTISLLANPVNLSNRISAVDNVYIANNLFYNHKKFKPQNNSSIISIDILHRARIAYCTYIQDSCVRDNHVFFISIPKSRSINSGFSGKARLTIRNCNMKVSDGKLSFLEAREGAIVKEKGNINEGTLHN